jgi:phasin family protein
MTTLPPLKNLEDVAAIAQGNVEEIVKVGQEHAEKLQVQLTKGYEDFASFSKANIEAVAASSAVVVKGAEDLTKAYAALLKGSFEKYVAAGKAIASAKSFDEVTALSNDLAKSGYESLVAEAGKLQELSVQVANEALAPLSARFTVAVEKFAKPLAA